MDSELVNLITIPLFSGAIGYVTNWSGVLMLFYPVSFKGFKVPGLLPMTVILPRKLRQIPGVSHGGLGWQGIIPSRAAKMGSISVDKGIAKLGSPSDFYEQLEPDKIAQHILESARGDIRELVERIMEREHPRLWHDLPPQLREAVHARVQQQLPDIVREVTDGIGANIDHLIDIKLMVIRHLEENPEMANKIYLEVGRKELKFIVNFGFFFGFLLGIPVAFITQAFDHWWVLPILGVIVGYTTNLVAIKMIFEPIEPRKFGRWTWQGLFLQRQPEVADIYARVISDNVITLSNIGDELLKGPQSDRTRHMITSALRPAVDRAVGPARGAVRVAMGRSEYDAIRDSVAVEAVEYTVADLYGLVRRRRAVVDAEADRAEAERGHAHRADRPRVQQAPKRLGSRADQRADARDAALGLLGDAAHRDARGRVAALPARRRARIRRGLSSPELQRAGVSDAGASSASERTSQLEHPRDFVSAPNGSGRGRPERIADDAVEAEVWRS